MTKTITPFDGDCGVWALKAVIQTHDKKVTYGFQETGDMLIDLDLNTKEGHASNMHNCY